MSDLKTATLVTSLLATDRLGVGKDTPTDAWRGILTSRALQALSLIADAGDLGTIRAALGVSPKVTSVSAPAQVTADQNDYALPDADVTLIDLDANRTITGFVAPGAGERTTRWVQNNSAFVLSVAHQSASSTAANRVIGLSSPVTVGPGERALLFYETNAGLNRWRLF